MKYLLTVLLFCLVGCSSSNTPKPDSEFKRVDFTQLAQSINAYEGERVVFDAYVLGSEYNPSEDGRQFFILSLGDEAKPGHKNPGHLFFPEVKNKLRAAEDGYNGGVIVNCYKMADNARKLGHKITIYAECKPNRNFYYYGTGVDLHISKMKVGEKTVNTDYADKSKMAAEAPGYFKSVYNGGKKIFDLAKNLRP